MPASFERFSCQTLSALKRSRTNAERISAPKQLVKQQGRATRGQEPGRTANCLRGVADPGHYIVAISTSTELGRGEDDMPRTPRVVLVDVVHHVVARGANRMRMFANRSEKQQYLRRFCLIAGEEKVLIHGYCLMDNHVHWLLTPTSSKGLARLFRRAHTWWAMVFNRKHDHSGPLFQGRYHSSPLSEDHYWTALRYVELNPRRAGMVGKAEDFEFSSARAHLADGHHSRVPLADVPTRQQFTRPEWREFLERNDFPRETALRRAQPLSRPCGNSEWIHELESRLGRKLTWSPPGRPPATNHFTAN
jgi:putative transposase